MQAVHWGRQWQHGIYTIKKRFIPADFDSMKGTYLGPSFTNKEIESDLKSCKANFKKFKDEHLIEEVSNALKDGKAVGWMQGRMEFGPRALGSRSIIADSRSPFMQKQLNLKVKYRGVFVHLHLVF